MTDANRKAAYLILRDVESGSAYSNLAVNRRLRSCEAGSHAFVRELVYGVLRKQFLLDFNIARFLRAPKLKAPERCLLRMGFYQLAFMDSVADHAGVSATVDLAAGLIKGRQGFINAVLRNFVRDGKRILLPEEGGEEYRLSVKYSCSEDIVRLWLGAYGRAKTEEILENFQRPPAVAVRFNPLRGMTPQELGDQGFSVRESSLCPGAYVAKGSGLLDTQDYRNGRFSVQGEASQLAVRMLAPSPGDLLIDMCAAPGGKSCAAAELMAGRGRIIAWDLHPHRAALIEKEAARLGITIIEASARDSAMPDAELSGKADCVICDVPCSGLGTIGKNPEIKLRPLGDISELLETQRRLLDTAAGYVKPGGKLLYSSCTIDPAENEEQTDRFAAERTDFETVACRRIFPSEEGCDGFYICLLRRKNG